MSEKNGKTDLFATNGPETAIWEITPQGIGKCLAAAEYVCELLEPST
jgi:hypothetical protein